MEQYEIFRTDVACDPVNGDYHRRGAKLIKAVSLAEAKGKAKTIAENKKNDKTTAEDKEKDWDRVFIFRRKADGSKERIGAYHRDMQGNSPPRYYDLTETPQK